MHPKYLCSTALVPTLLACAALMMSTPALADAIVLRSAVPSLPAGTVVRDGQMLRLSDGVFIELLLPSGETQRLQGPMRERYVTSAPPAPSMIGAFVAMFKARASNERLGGVRNSDLRCVSESRRDWNAIATDWNAGCRREALAQFDERLK